MYKIAQTFDIHVWILRGFIEYLNTYTPYQPISHVFLLISMNRDPQNRGEYKLRYLAYKRLAGFAKFLKYALIN
jgi:hypothetical protein